MGNSTFSNVIVQFKNSSFASTAFENFKNFITKSKTGLLSREIEFPHYKSNENINGDYDISKENLNDDTISFFVSSSRYPNCLWQCENLKNYFQYQPGCVSFEADIFELNDSISWYEGEE